jgi:predicted Ser/Thr protein kinase
MAAPPPPLSLFGLRSKDPTRDLEKFLYHEYHTHFTLKENDTVQKSNEIGSFYYRMNGYDYIYVFIYDGKKYLIKFSSESPFKANITNEWNMYTRIYALHTHTFVVQGVKGGIFDNYAYIILPFVEGNTLRESLPLLTKQGIVNVLLTVTDALEEMFHHNICHGDMHWDNILLTDDGVKIIDFDKTGPCDEASELGNMYIGSSTAFAVRQDYDFIGAPLNMNTGFFLLCKRIFNYMNKPTGYIELIIKTYIDSNHTKEDIQQAYTSLKNVLQGASTSKGGRRTSKRRLRGSRSRRISSSK